MLLQFTVSQKFKLNSIECNQFYGFISRNWGNFMKKYGNFERIQSKHCLCLACLLQWWQFGYCQWDSATNSAQMSGARTNSAQANPAYFIAEWNSNIHNQRTKWAVDWLSYEHIGFYLVRAILLMITIASYIFAVQIIECLGSQSDPLFGGFGLVHFNVQ